jgi:ribose transport system ATP-binding protein
MGDQSISFVEDQRGPLLKICGISKNFTGTKALDCVDFDVRPGEIHALLGENGAGKSTLIKILAGVYPPNQGDFWIKGQQVTWPFEHLPITFIHQDLGLVDSMTVAENVALVAGYQRHHGFISWQATKRTAERILQTMGIHLDPDIKVAALSSAEKSIVAIARALAIKTDLIVLDEPTATLPENDVAVLFNILNQLRARKMGIIYVTHRLDEVFKIADRVTVLRNGKKVYTRLITETTPEELILKIVGKPPSEVFIKPPAPAAADLMEIVQLKVGTAGPVSFKLKKGEILGLVGLRGAGHDLIGRGIFGDRAVQSGQILVNQKEIHVRNQLEAMKCGIGFVSSKRGEESLACSLTVRENIFLNPLNPMQGKIKVLSKLDLIQEHKRCDEAIQKFSIRPNDSERPVSTLSGGNQQKTILARWFEVGSDILILEEPTLGVDVGAKADIYAMMASEVEKGKGILLISSDFEEIAGVCHRALVFNHGKVVTEVLRDDLSIEHLTRLASGITPQTA